MDDVAGPAVDDRVILVLAFACRTAVAPVLVTGDAATEVPATWSLAKVSADRSHLPQRRRSDNGAGLREDAIPLEDDRIVRQLLDARRRSDAKRPVFAK